MDKNQIINHDYFIAGKKVVIDGTVNGDAYVAGGQIDVNGTINGDLLIAGGQINIRGDISQNVRAAGGNVIIEGNVGKNIAVAGGNLTLYRTAKIAGNTVIAGGNLTIGNNILGDVTAGVGTLNILPNATINGNLNYWSRNKAIVSPNAKIIKQTIFHQTHFQTNFKKPSEKAFGTIFGIGLFFTTVGFVSSLILGILLIWLLPVYTQKAVEVIKNKFWLSCLVGFITLIVIPITIFVLFITLIGAPVAFALIFIYFLTLYIAKLLAALTIGKFVAENTKLNSNLIWTFVIGIVLYYAVGFIPVVGMLIKIIVTLASVGAIAIQKKNYYSMFRKKKLI